MTARAPRRTWTGAAVIALAALATLGVSVLRPLGGDDVYVIDNLGADAWSRRLFAFDFDAPSADYVPWWTGVAFQRRFLRVPSSALLWIEWRLFGRSAAPYHLVTLALVVASCLLVYRLALRRVSVVPAVAIAILPALHPASAEVVGSLSCQPLATAGLFCVATATAWVRMRRSGSRGALAATILFCALAMTSYEAAIALPFALLMVDVVIREGLAPSRRVWGPRLAVLGVLVAYAPWAIAIRRGLTSPDTGPMRPLGEVARSARLDATAYCLKAFGVFDAHDPTAYWLHRAAGEPVAVAVALILLGGIVARVRRERRGWVGLAVLASFLIAPWLTRATVAQLNLPTLRQIYLPILLGGPLVVAALRPRARAPAVIAGGCLWLVALGAQAVSSGVASYGGAAARALEPSLRGVLARVPADCTVIGIGDDLCGTSPALLRAGSASFAIPPAIDGAMPELVAIDAHPLVVRVPGAFDVPAREEPPVRTEVDSRGPAWTVRRPPPVVSLGWQRIPGATVSVVKRGPRGIQALRFVFDRPLSELAFLRLRGCDAPERVEPRPGGG